MSDKSTLIKKENGYFHGQRQEMLKFIPEKAIRILEVGCGEGTFCQKLQRPDREIWGVEMNPDAAQKATEVCTFVLTGDFNEIYTQMPKNHFDCIIFNDVLEHIYAPWDTVKLVKTLLSPSGVLVTSIPNFRFISNLIEIIIHGEFRYRPEGGILDDTHLRFFTNKSMKSLFEEQGYKLILQEGIGERNDWKMILLNSMSFGKMNDSRFRQFVNVAKPIL